MIYVPLGKEYFKLIESRAPSLDIGGFSNLDKKDLSKASRLDYQYTGLYGELAWYLYRYGNPHKFVDVLDDKFAKLRPQNKGDNGFDDSITHNNKTRLLDVKSTYVENKERIKYLNLVIPQREFHNNMIYVCAFTVGKDRRNIDEVVLAGWCIDEDVHKKWKYDNSKFCVPIKDLRDIKELDLYIR
jgi:hypothetical protein